MVAEVDRVGKRLERERVLGQAGHRQRTRDGAERQHEVIPRDRLRAFVGLDGGRLRLEVDAGRAAEDHLGVRTHRAQRHDAVARLERSGRSLREQRRVEHEVLVAHDRCPALAELAGDVSAGEAAAEHEHPAAGLSFCGHVP